MARGAAAAWAWPLAGLAVALPAAGLGWAALMLGLPAPIAAGLVLALQVLITGALHEDGLADCADGFWGGWTRARRLEIMADSRIGAYGVLALILGLGLGWAGLSAAMAGPGWALWLISAALMSRGAMVWGMASLPRARPGGLSARVGRPSYRTAGLALGIAAAGSLGLLGLSALLPLALSAICLLALRRLAQNRIGGQTGDVLGGMQACIAILVLICASAGL